MNETMLSPLMTRGELFHFNSDDVRFIELNGMYVEIDVMIVELIKVLNKFDFKTSYCCSGHDEDAYITSYIMFEQLSEEQMVAIEEMISSISQLVIEHNYTIFNREEHILLVNPSEKYKDMAYKIISKDLQIPEDELEITENICIRNKFLKQVQANPDIDMEEYVELNKTANKVCMYITFRILSELIISYSTNTDRYNQLIKQLKEYNNTNTGKYTFDTLTHIL